MIGFFVLVLCSQLVYHMLYYITYWLCYIGLARSSFEFFHMRLQKTSTNFLAYIALHYIILSLYVKHKLLP